MLYKTRPKKFNPTAHIVSCYSHYNNQILLLKRHSNKYQGGSGVRQLGKLILERDYIRPYLEKSKKRPTSH